MKKSMFKVVFYLSLAKIAFILAYLIFFKNASISTYSEQQIKEIKSKVISSEVIAKTNKETKIYSDMELKNLISKIPLGQDVEILKDRSKEIYFVKSEILKLKGWIKKEDIDIPESPQTNEDSLTKKEIESFINDILLESETQYLVWVDIDRQLTYVLKGRYKNWSLEKILSCSTGLNVSPTTRGVFKISEKGEWFYSERLGSGAKNWVRFNDSYLFHSVAMDKNKNIIDHTLGKRSSSGCVRMSVDDIKWFYDTIPAKTTVFIN